LKIGVFGLTINSNRARYVRYQNAHKVARGLVKFLREKKKVHVVIALTHLALEADRRLAREVPGIDLILGGHEHDHKGIAGAPPIYKADANAKTVYVHRLKYNFTTGELVTKSVLRDLGAKTPEDKEIAAVVGKWTKIAYAGFQGFQPDQEIARISFPLDGRESAVRNSSSRLTELTAKSLRRAVPGSHAAIYNSGSIRIDDVIQPGPVTQYDVIRILPFGGKILTVELRGDILLKVLAQGRENRGEGGFLQTDGVKYLDEPAKSKAPGANKKSRKVKSRKLADRFLLNGKKIRKKKVYKIAMNDYLLLGLETGLSFLKDGKPGVKVAEEGPDMRVALINELKRLK